MVFKVIMVRIKFVKNFKIRYGKKAGNIQEKNENRKI
jgi:hypothetical protein